MNVDGKVNKRTAIARDGVADFLWRQAQLQLQNIMPAYLEHHCREHQCSSAIGTGLVEPH